MKTIKYGCSWFGVVFAAVVVAVFLVATNPVLGCKACNVVFADEIMTARADSLLGRDLQRAAQNQRGLPLEGYSDMAASGRSLADVITPRVVDRPEPVVLAQAISRKTGIPDVTPKEHVMPDYMKKAKFPEIVARDAQLPIPPTSYVPQDAPANARVNITLHEGKTYIGNGVVYDGFLIDGKVPGPTVIVEEGDIVEFTVKNDGTVPHGASIHAAYTQTSKYLGSIAPGQTKTLRFKATYPGVYLYHCAPGGHAIPMHVLAGQYGMMVVKPKAQPAYQLEKDMGRKPDLELYLVQHELYASGKDAIEGRAAYTMFNGRLFRYVEEPIRVRPGDFVRIYFLNVGPNLISTFHIVGIIWDYVYWQGHPDARWPGGQTVTAGPSDSWVIEFRVPPEEGAYTMLSHAVGSTSRGAIGLLVAESNANTPAEVFADGPEYSDKEAGENLEKATRVISPFRPGTHPVDRPVVYGPEVEEVIISIIGNSYWPKVVQVSPGTKITWINEDVFTYLAGEYSGIHNVAATKTPEKAEGFVSPLLAHGESFNATLNVEGEYSYICTPHPYMEGRIIVKGRAKVADHHEHAMAIEAEKPVAPAVVDPDLVTSISITGDDRMRFDQTAFSVPAGADITLVFNNIGKLPKQVMGHNLVILDKGLNGDTFSAASIRHPDKEYIAPEYAGQVVAATRVLGPGESETLKFKAPSAPGAYPFVCSFPGHTPAGMRGVMTVK